MTPDRAPGRPRAIRPASGAGSRSSRPEPPGPDPVDANVQEGSNDIPLETILETGDLPLSSVDEERIRHQLETLERRLANHPEPTVEVVLGAFPVRRQVEAKVRLRLGPLGGHLVSLRAAETADRAVHLAVEDLERQLERRLARQRGEPTFGVPSRRLPKRLRPNPPVSGEPEPPET